MADATYKDTDIKKGNEGGTKKRNLLIKNTDMSQIDQTHRFKNDTKERKLKNIKIDLNEIEWESVDWIYLAQDRDKWQGVMYVVMNFQIP